MAAYDVRAMVNSIYPTITNKLESRDPMLTLIERSILALPGAMTYLENLLNVIHGGTYADLFEAYVPPDHISDRTVLNGLTCRIDELVKTYEQAKNEQWNRLAEAYLGAVWGGHEDIRTWVEEKWMKFQDEEHVTNLYYFGLIGAFNRGDESEILKYGRLCKIEVVRERSTLSSQALNHLKLECSSLDGVKLYFSPAFANLRMDHRLRLTFKKSGFKHLMAKRVIGAKPKKKKPDVISVDISHNQIERILTRGDEAQISWLFYNVLDEKIDTRFLTRGNPFLMDFYHQHVSDIKPYFSSYLAYVLQHHGGLGSVRYIMEKGYVNWREDPIWMKSRSNARISLIFRELLTQHGVGRYNNKN